MNTDLHFSSKTDLWATPQNFFDELNKEFKFTVDLCATPENAKCSRFFTSEDDGLIQRLVGETVWINPPYGRTISKWVQKGYELTGDYNTVVMLVPSRTDTKWFQDYCLRYGEVRFIRGRLKFGNAKANAPFPSAVVIFRP